MSHWIVDRIEGALAILEGPDGLVERPLAELPEGLQEGDALDDALRLLPRTRQAEAEARLARLKALSPDDGGDILL